ncbi:MAG: protein-glutamate O-methyltransferase CheR [Colwellia sp.]|nr:protein-glutamate O-methyltransferase CheR [Colwellia sp.]
MVIATEIPILDEQSITETLRTKNIEIDLFITAIKEKVGYDLSGYARASIKRRIEQLVIDENVTCIAELIPKLLYSKECQANYINRLTVNVSELFRHPNSFLSLRKSVLPYLESFPRRDIWIAGCATGEEAYSMAILLEEVGLLNNTQIHATDINTEVLKQAKTGILTKGLNKDDAARYQASGGTSSLSNYFSTAYNKHKLSQHLLDHISFSHHNILQDKVFCSAQLVMCRNVMIYFDLNTQNSALALFHNSLVQNGYLVIGEKESLINSPLINLLKTIDEPAKIYQRKSSANV